MARGKDAPISVGGNINPYVAEASMRGKQQAENRLLAATQEAGATQRATMAEQGATSRATAQMANQRTMQAAELEAQDKRAAETEKARREDREFSETMMKATQSFQAEQSGLEREYQNAVREKDLARADELLEKIEDARRFDYRMRMDESERSTNAIMSLTKMAMNKQTSHEQAITSIAQQKEQFEMDKGNYDQVVNNTVDGFNSDKRMDMPVLDVFKERMTEIKKSTVVESLYKGGLFKLAEVPKRAYEVYKMGKELKEGVADPLGVLQDQISMTGSPISIEELHPELVRELEQKIAKGDVVSQDVRNTMAALQGAVQALTDRVDGASAGKEQAFWKTKKAEVIQMRSSLERLRDSQVKVAGSDVETVGARVKSALGILGTSPGSQVAAIAAALGTSDMGQIIDEMSKPLTVPSLIEPPQGASPYYRSLCENWNSVNLEKYPDLMEER